MTFRAIHYRQVCQYGFTHGQCRCPAPDKAVDRVECPTPATHGRPAPLEGNTDGES
jgi:hypothetical protein